MINELLTAAAATPVDKFNTQFAYVDLPEGRLSVTITHYNGGDGQVRKINTRKEWVYAGKTVKIADLRKKFG